MIGFFNQKKLLLRIKDSLKKNGDKKMAKRVNMDKAKFLVLLRGQYNIVACEPDGNAFLCVKKYETRQKAYIAILNCDINKEGWIGLGPFKPSRMTHGNNKPTNQGAVQNAESERNDQQEGAVQPEGEPVSPEGGASSVQA